MAGSPVQKIAPYVKKYGVEIYIALGFLLYAKMWYGDRKTYKSVYGEHDFQRQYILEKIDEYIEKDERRHQTEGEADQHEIKH